MVELPLSAGDIYDLVAGSTEIKLSETITRREPNYFKGPPGLKRQIIIDLWAPYLALVRKCCCTGIKECQATVVAFENFLEIMKNQADFGPKFKNLCHSMPISRGLKLAIVEYFAQLIPHRALIGYVLNEDRERIEPAKSLDITWIGTELNQPLKNAVTKTEFEKSIELARLRNEKSTKLANFEMEMAERQRKLKSEIGKVSKTVLNADLRSLTPRN